jgi:hypothetical protein
LNCTHYAVVLEIWFEFFSLRLVEGASVEGSSRVGKGQGQRPGEREIWFQLSGIGDDLSSVRRGNKFPEKPFLQDYQTSYFRRVA